MTEPTWRRLLLGLVLTVVSVLALQDQLAGHGGSSPDLNRRVAPGGGGAPQKVCSDSPAAAPAEVAAAAAIAVDELPAAAARSSAQLHGKSWPHLLPLTHSRVPVVQNNRTVSHKSVYYGRISIGYPEQQEFKVVFDTGSAHAIVASIECQEHACLMHQRYNGSMSSTSVDINIDGSWVQSRDNRDTVTVGFGTGSVYANIVRERLCISSELASDRGRGGGMHKKCSTTNMLVARQMSVLFETATFDGIVGLSFPKLALSKEFSFLSCLNDVMGPGAPPRFAFFLADDTSGRGSELALGGHNPDRLRGPVSWVPISNPEEGHWKVDMRAVAVGGRDLEMCRGGGCQGIVDTGTSHLGVPKEDLRALVELLSKPALESTDCRLVDGEEVVIQLDGLNLTLAPWEYMRPLPLRAGTLLNKDHLDNWVEVPAIDETGAFEAIPPEENSTRFACTPRLFPVVLKPGQKIFLLGEPVLQRYYSIFDWGTEAVGFGLADQQAEVATNNFDDATLLQTSTRSGLHRAVHLERRFAVEATEGLEDATSIGTALGSLAALRL